MTHIFLLMNAFTVVEVIIKIVDFDLSMHTKESTSEDHMPSQKFKYRRKRLLARAYGPRRPSYLHLSLKEILRPYLRK